MIVIITGASRGIGFETCIRFLKNGDVVYAIARSQIGLDALKKFEREGDLKIIKADLSDAQQLESTLLMIKKTTNHIDLIINNAGYLVNKKFEDTCIEDFDKSINVNLKTPYFLIQKLLPLLLSSESGQIINIGSMGGYPGSSKFPGLSIYSAAKGALATFTECLAEELKEKNIKVNCLALGAVQTEMLEKAFPGYQAPVNPMEMADFIYGFATHTSKLINGKVIPVSLITP
jgi:3-oxoacyl-[acyl-carrier protein] reductase